MKELTEAEQILAKLDTLDENYVFSTEELLTLRRIGAKMKNLGNHLLMNHFKFERTSVWDDMPESARRAF